MQDTMDAVMHQVAMSMAPRNLSDDEVLRAESTRLDAASDGATHYFYDLSSILHCMKEVMRRIDDGMLRWVDAPSVLGIKEHKLQVFRKIYHSKELQVSL